MMILMPMMMTTQTRTMILMMKSSLKRRMRYFAVISLYCRFASSRVALGTQSSMLR